MGDVTPRFAVFRRAKPDAPLYAYMAWITEQRRAFHVAQRAIAGHGWHDTHDCLDCAAAMKSGEFDAWLDEVIK